MPSRPFASSFTVVDAARMSSFGTLSVGSGRRCLRDRADEQEPGARRRHRGEIAGHGDGACRDAATARRPGRSRGTSTAKAPDRPLPERRVEDPGGCERQRTSRPSRPGRSSRWRRTRGSAFEPPGPVHIAASMPSVAELDGHACRPDVALGHVDDRDCARPSQVDGPRLANPAVVWPTTVKVPVTAIALVGMPPRRTGERPRRAAR